MLKKLYIKNYALIDLLDIELYPGFSVLLVRLVRERVLSWGLSVCCWVNVLILRVLRLGLTDVPSRPISICRGMICNRSLRTTI